MLTLSFINSFLNCLWFLFKKILFLIVYLFFFKNYFSDFLFLILY